MFANLYSNYYSPKHVASLEKNFEMAKHIPDYTRVPVIRLDLKTKDKVSLIKAEIALNAHILGGGKIGILASVIRYRLRSIRCTNVIIKTALSDDDMAVILSIGKFIDLDYYCNTSVILKSILVCNKQFNVNNLRFVYDLSTGIDSKAIYQLVFGALEGFIDVPDEFTDEILIKPEPLTVVLAPDNATFSQVIVLYEEEVLVTRHRVQTYEHTFEDRYSEALRESDLDRENRFPRVRRTADFMKADYSDADYHDQVDLIAERKLKILFLDYDNM